jgi:hypothetical protein
VAGRSSRWSRVAIASLAVVLVACGGGEERTSPDVQSPEEVAQIVAEAAVRNDPELCAHLTEDGLAAVPGGDGSEAACREYMTAKTLDVDVTSEVTSAEVTGNSARLDVSVSGEGEGSSAPEAQVLVHLVREDGKWVSERTGSPEKVTAAADAEAQATLLAAQLTMITYATDNGDSFEGVSIAKLRAIEPDLAEAEFEIRKAASDSYELAAKSASGTEFSVSGAYLRGTEYDCSNPGVGRCPSSGDWGPA